MVQILLDIFLFIVLIVVMIDLLPLIRDWSSRIKIGKFQEFKNWNQMISNQGAKWLVKTPKIKVTDNTRLIVIDMLKGNDSKSAIQHWQEGALILGLSELLKTNEDLKVKKSIEKFLDSTFDADGQWLKKPDFVDSAILAYAVMKLDYIDSDQFKKAFDYTWKMIEEHIGEDGTVMYRQSMKNYRYVDTIGFICPFLIAYGRKYGFEKCIDLAVMQLKEYEKHGMHKEFYIPNHAYNIENRIPLGLYGWGRGLGWFALGLVDSWNELSVNHKYKPELEEMVKKYAEAIMSFQQNNGAWNWTVTRNESRPDSSATATLSWFLVNAAGIESISERCFECSSNALKFLATVTRRSGAVDFSQGDTKDIGVYSGNFNILPFTQGFTIRSINLYLRMMQSRGKIESSPIFSKN